MNREQIITALGVDKPLARSETEIMAVPEVAPMLISIMNDEELGDGDHALGGWPPIHAARLLGMMKSELAIAPMIELLRTTDWEAIIHDSIIQALPMIGAPVVEPALAAYATQDEELRTSLANVLAECGVRDERIYQLLLERFEHDQRDPGIALASYGDRRALPFLIRAYDEFQIVQNDKHYANGILVDLRDGIELLGGTLTVEQEAKFEIAMEPVSEAPSLPAVRRERPGRNDPCWCGSTKKYKKCHLEADDLAASSR